MTKNRNPVKQLFITFPHSVCDKNTFRDNLLRFEPEYYKIAEEKHKTGEPHLHAVIKFKNKYSKSIVLKHFKQLYPDDYKRIDIQAVRSIKKSIEYLSKEDPTPLESGEFKDSRGYSKEKLIKYHILQFRLLLPGCISKEEEEQILKNIKTNP